MKAYCEKCDKFVDYELRKEIKTITVRGLTFETDFYHACCKECHEEASANEVWRLNDKIVYDKYRKLSGLLTSDEMKAIRQKRGMSQVELARFIGCGEKNIARYETGTIQDRVFDNLIRMVGDDDCYYAMIKLKEKTPTLVTQ